MQIVIDIPEAAYKLLQSDEGVDWLGAEHILHAVSKGTPLPKGHGDLIDRNSILCDDCSCEQCGHTDECFKLLAQTIIEADKEESERKR